MTLIKKLLLDISTTKDGKSFDNGRVLGILIVGCFIVFTAVSIVFTHRFDAVNFGIAVGSIFTGLGINLKLKEGSEPNEQ